jgi:hypothetical protein
MTPWDMRKRVIASVQGHCLGGGCEMVMMCDVTIAADDALFGEPEIRFSRPVTHSLSAAYRGAEREDRAERGEAGRIRGAEREDRPPG